MRQIAIVVGLVIVRALVSTACSSTGVAQHGPPGAGSAVAKGAGANGAGGDAGVAGGTNSSGAIGDGGGTGDGGDEAGGARSEAGTGGDAGSHPPGNCLSRITDYEDAGPFTYTVATTGSVHFWVPKVTAGCKVPVIHFAIPVGAGASACSDYGNVLERMASHGFLTTCYEGPTNGVGADGLAAFEAALAMYPDLADNKLGSTGHSQGGESAIITLQFAEARWGTTMIYAGLSMEPASGFGDQRDAGTWQDVYGAIKSPVFVFDGTGDMLVSSAWVGQGYSALNPKSENYWWSAVGATHVPPPFVPEEQVSIPWFRWKLLGDNAACKFFKGIPGNAAISPGWTVVMSENEEACQ